jgi:hypothetical protein
MHTALQKHCSLDLDAIQRHQMAIGQAESDSPVSSWTALAERFLLSHQVYAEQRLQLARILRMHDRLINIVSRRDV